MADAVSLSSDASVGSVGTDYEGVRENILFELEQIEGPSSFAYASEVTTAPNPGLTVEGIGAIGLPLSDRDAKQVIDKCRQSPFGKDIVYRELALNCGRQHVVPELYKLLLYEKGAFFRSHQDSEKTPGMFVTLVDEYRFDSSKSSAFGTAFAAWYSDVFHEVQKVTGGYRLVLTYNLVQRGSSVPQKAPDGDGSRRLMQDLQRYNRGLEANYAGWPNFLAYSLEHTYSQAGLSLSALKGRDFAIVDNLKSVCDQIEFDVYLALKEKCIDKDDDCGSEEFDRSETFKYVHDLDGRSQAVAPKYDAINLLDDGTATDDEEADESEHEGWTGNEGAPAHYWYRTSMVLIVPPSRKVDFCLDTDETNFRAILMLIKKYTVREPAPDSYEARQLRRACQLSIKKSARPSYGYSRYSFMLDEKKDDSERQCMEEVAEVTLQRDWYDTYAELPSKWKLTTSALETLGAYLASREYDVNKWKCLEALLHTETSLQAQLEALRALQKGTKKGTTPEEAKNWMHDTGRMILNKTLESTTALRKAAGETIADIFVEYGLELHDPVLAALRTCTTPTAAAFLLRLAASVTASEDTPQTRMLEQVTTHLWSSSFAFEGPEYRTRVPRAWGSAQSDTTERDHLTKDEVVALLEVTQQHSSMPAFDAIRVLSQALPMISSTYAKEQMLPFISLLIRRNVEVLFPHNTRTPNETVIELIKAGLTAIITNHVGPEPQRPKNFALPRGSCNCRDCSPVNDFLALQQKQFQFPCRKGRRAHLHSQFTDRGKGQYEVTTLRNSNPNVWQITKTSGKRYSSDHQASTLRVKWLDGELRKLAKVESGLLTEDLLGKDVHRGIMGCTIEGLNSAAGGRALTEASGNARKRKAGDGEDGDTKKAKGMSWPGGVEIVDLTRREDDC